MILVLVNVPFTFSLINFSLSRPRSCGARIVVPELTLRYAMQFWLRCKIAIVFDSLCLWQ